MDNKINYKLVNILLGVAIICLIYAIRGLWLGILAKIIAVLLPFLVGFAVSYALYPYWYYIFMLHSNGRCPLSGY